MQKTLSHKIIPFLWHLTKGYRIVIGISFAMAIVASITSGFLTPYLVKNLIQTLSSFTGTKDTFFNQVGGAFLFLFLANFLSEVCTWAGIYLRMYYVPLLRARSNHLLFSLLNKHSFSYFSNHLTGSLSNKMSDIAGAINPLISIVSWSLIPVSLISMANIIMFGFISPVFGAILLTWVLIHIGTIIIFTPYFKRKNEESSEARSNVSGRIADVISNFMSLKLFSRTSFEEKELSKLTQTMIKKHRASWNASNTVLLCLDISYLIFYVCFLGLMGFSFQNGTLAIAEIVYMFLALGQIIEKVWQVSWDFPELSEQIGTLSQALKTIIQPQTVQDVENAKPLHLKQGEILLKDLDFKYQNEFIFKGLNLHIKGGEKVGIVGLSGAGKSTLVHLILRLYDVNAGTISIDGQNIATIQQESLRNQIAMVAQENSLFHRTLSENIAYGKPSASKKEIEQAAKYAHAHNFIRKLEKGYNSEVGERGIKLSGGQRQRIAIARAFLKDAPILILDEATSALDSETEKVIQSSLSKLMKGRTTLAIAHRLSTLLEMDRLIILDQGKIVESGTHAELLKKKDGVYAKLWKMQSGGFLPEINKKEFYKRK